MSAPETPLRITRVAGRAVAIRGRDIDTDRIVPARFLRAITFEGLEHHLFEDDRRGATDRGETHPLDAPASQGARLLLVNQNFGCGSSREHAPQAIARWGIRAIVGESFADIFFGNAVAIGLPCLAAAGADIERLMALSEREPSAEFTVDLAEPAILAAGRRLPATLSAAARAAFLSGEWDVTGLLLEGAERLERTRARLPYLNGFRA